jgi:transcriptional regulator with XRE-family HTH domain
MRPENASSISAIHWATSTRVPLLLADHDHRRFEAKIAILNRRQDRMASAVAKIIDDLRDRGGLKGTDVANIAAVSPATVSRWTTGKALPHPKTQLIISDLRYVVDRLSEFYSPEETRLWLYSKHRLLDGKRAIDLINQGQADKVLAVIESLDEGTFT